MTYLTRAYDDDNGQPVAVLVVTGTHDVSRLINTLAGSPAPVEQLQAGRKLLAQVRRHNGGRAALELLAAHGGPDFTPDNTTIKIGDGEASLARDEETRLTPCGHARDEQCVSCVPDDGSFTFEPLGGAA